jgi:hypothetical protein
MGSALKTFEKSSGQKLKPALSTIDAPPSQLPSRRGIQTAFIAVAPLHLPWTVQKWVNQRLISAYMQEDSEGSRKCQSL